MKLDPGFILTALVSLFSALPVTLEITVISVLFGFIIGTTVALMRYFEVPVLRTLAHIYVVVIRGTPMLIHLLLIYSGISTFVDGLAEKNGWTFRSSVIPLIDFAFLSFSVTAGAYFSEIIRSGLLAVRKGQIEAAYSIGMTTFQTLRRIVFPQALAAVVPNISNLLIGMLHGSTLVFAISIVDINAKAQIEASSNWKFFESYIAAAIIYWGLTILIERLTGWVEGRLNRFNRGGIV
ncbi:amino acid ABC transporter permease [Bacillus sp. BRMEA1]|uniref:amino acid ABC transporter permease n=1 Tax=Neobacillus endophyticus TaxID=2738405 RepID=UPI001567C237|nr:amino acid ABC transporter permease [Neobacillus endophyticus]NRD79733.1 amino acid ABC transporter permease [Neobacillus endophyticus]